MPAGVKADGRLDIGESIPVKDQKKMDRFIHLGMVAASEAVEFRLGAGCRGGPLRDRRDDGCRHWWTSDDLRGVDPGA